MNYLNEVIAEYHQNIEKINQQLEMLEDSDGWYADTHEIPFIVSSLERELETLRGQLEYFVKVRNNQEAS